MADSELEQIRAARLAQLKQQGGGQSNGQSGEEDVESRRQAAEEQKASILNQILEPDAADRLGRIRMVKASRAEDVESRLIMLARSGQLRQKVTDEQLKQMLNSLTEHENAQSTTKTPKVLRRTDWDDDDDLDDLLNDV